MKAVVNHSQSYSVIISDKCQDVSNEHSSKEASITYCVQTVCKKALLAIEERSTLAA